MDRHGLRGRGGGARQSGEARREVGFEGVQRFVDRGALGVMGQPYHLLLPRSVDFTPFFDAVARTASPFEQALLVYLTDGDGGFPGRAPEFETLWVVTEGGEDDFPFGQVARLADRYQRQASEAIP